jgi:hypothetical protein
MPDLKEKTRKMPESKLPPASKKTLQPNKTAVTMLLSLYATLINFLIE